jgi:ubiquinone/menaquinone biosynthesis C-methylase UbiE
VFLGQENSLRDKAVRLIGLEAGETVLDLACGNGINFRLVEKRVSENGRIIGFDPGNLQLLRHRLAEDL